MAHCAVETVLIVAQSERLRVELCETLERIGVESIRISSSEEEALAQLSPEIDVTFVGLDLPQHAAERLLRCAAQLCPSHPVVLVSTLTGGHPDLFSLVEAGTFAHLQWPASPQRLTTCLSEVVDAHHVRAKLEAVARTTVGRMGLRDVRDCVRAAMLDHALRANRGSLRSTARTLKVSRSAVQRMVRELLNERPRPGSDYGKPAEEGGAGNAGSVNKGRSPKR